MTDPNINGVLIFIICLLVAWIIVSLFMKKTTIVEEKPKTQEGYRHFRNRMVSDKESPDRGPYFDNSEFNVPNRGPGFHIRDSNARYMANSCESGCVDCGCDPSVPQGYGPDRAFGPNYGLGIDPLVDRLPCLQNTGKWKQRYEPGANNTTGDLRWNRQSPKMTLIDNCLNCNKWKTTTNLNSPPGIMNDVTSQYSEYNPVNLDAKEFPINGYPQVIRGPPNIGVEPVHPQP